MSDEPTDEVPERPTRVVVIGIGSDTEPGRELARRILADSRLRGRVEILDLNAAVERIQAERDQYTGPVVPQEMARQVDPYPMHPLDGQSKYDRRRKWWNR